MIWSKAEGGYEPGQGSQPAHDIDPPGSQPVDVSHPEEESHYVPHIAGGDEAGESSQSAGIAGSGLADGDEEGEQMQNLMENEDFDGMADELDSDNPDEEDEEGDDEAVIILDAWNHDLSTGLTMNDDNVQIGVIYVTKKQLKNAVTQWAMSTQRVFHTHISSPQNLTLLCVEDGFPGKVHGHVPKYDVHWVVSDVVPHTCVRQNLL